MSAASFSGKGFGNSPENKIDESEDTTEILTPTLPVHDNNEESKNARFYRDLDHELLSN